MPVLTEYYVDLQYNCAVFCFGQVQGYLIASLTYYHRLNMELDLQSLFELLCTAVLID